MYSMQCLVECQVKSAKKSVRFAAVLCNEKEPESYQAGHVGGMVFYPAPPQHEKPAGAFSIAEF